MAIEVDAAQDVADAASLAAKEAALDVYRHLSLAAIQVHKLDPNVVSEDFVEALEKMTNGAENLSQVSQRGYLSRS